MLISKDSADLICNEIHTIMRCPIFLTDEDGTVIASTEASFLDAHLPDALERLRQGEEYVILNENLSEDEICFPICVNGQIMGMIGMISPSDNRQDIISHYSGTIRRIAEVRTQRLSRRMSQEEEQGYFDRARQIFFESTLFSGMLSEFLNDEEILFRGSLLGIDLTQPRIIVILGFDTDPSYTSEGACFTKLSQKNISDFAAYLKRSIAFHSQNFCFADKQRVVMLFCSNSSSEILEVSTRLCEDLEHFYSIRVYGGISTVADNPTQFQRCYTQAKIACNIARDSHQKRLLPYDVTSPTFIAKSLSSELKSALYSAVFGNCSEDEIREMSELILTYCKHDGNIEQAATELYVHRNTFLYRLNKLRTVTGFNIKSPRDALILYLTVLAAR